MLGTTRFLDLDCVSLKSEALELLVTQSVGPRIIYFGLIGEQNLFAELPDFDLECPGTGIMTLWGGHRLWHAPEVKNRTYLPDNDPVAITEIEHGLKVVQLTEGPTGIQKSMRITLTGPAEVVVDHTLKNEGVWTVELAPWAITQLRPGGTAILPQCVDDADPDGVLANRRLAIWPYTDMNSSHLQWGNRYIFIRATMQAGALKIGFPNPVGWLAYHVDGTLFVKKAAYDVDADYFDFGSSSECYCRREFVEIETLGPRTKLAPGQSVTHQETWQAYAGVDFEPAEDAVAGLVRQLGL